MPPINAILPAAAAGLTSIILGAAFVAARFAMAETEPATLAFIRFAIAAACLAVFLPVIAERRVAPRDILPLLALGAIQFGAFHITYNAGLDIISAARAAIIFSLVPFMTMVIGAVFGYERLTAFKALGVVVTIVGVAVALGDRAGTPGDRPWIGEGLIFFSVCCGSTYNVLSRPYLARYPSVPASALAMAGGLILVLPFAVTEGMLTQPPSFSPGVWAAILFLGIPSGALGFFLWNWALRRATPTLVSVFLPLSPISAAGLGALILGETVSWPFYAGLALVIAGIWLAYRGPATQTED